MTRVTLSLPLFLALLAFLAAAAAANTLTATIGLVPIAPGVPLLMAAGTWAAGVALVARDAIYELGGRWHVAGAIVAGSVLSLVGAPWRIALASALAFAVSEVVDAIVYTRSRGEAGRRRGRAIVASTFVAAPVDTVLFLSVSGLGLSTAAVAGQWAAKVAVALVVAGLFLAVRWARRSSSAPAVA